MQIASILRNRIAFGGTILFVVQTCLLSFAAEPSFNASLSGPLYLAALHR